MKMNDSFKAFLLDTAERMFWTFVQGATGLLTVDALDWIDLGDITMWEAAGAGGVTALFSLLKSIAASRLAARNTAQLGVKTYAYEEAGPGAAGADI